ECDTSGNGEGQAFLGSTNVTTDATGTVTFAATVGAAPVGQPVFTATATDPANNTSEFSNCAEAAAGPATLMLAPKTAVNTVGTSHTVTATVRDPSGNPVQGVT